MVLDGFLVPTVAAGVVGTLIVIWLVEPLRVRVTGKVRDLLIGEKLEELPEKREGKIILIAEGIDEVLDQLESNEESVSEEAVPANVRPYQPIEKVEMADYVKQDISSDYSAFEDDLSEYNQLADQYEELRNEAHDDIGQYLLESREHPFRNISSLKNDNHAGQYADVVLNGRLPNPRHGAMSNNEDTLYLLIPGFRSDEEFEHYFDELSELVNDLVQQSAVIREQLQEIRGRYVSRYEIDETEIEQRKPD